MTECFSLRNGNYFRTYVYAYSDIRHTNIYNLSIYLNIKMTRRNTENKE